MKAPSRFRSLSSSGEVLLLGPRYPQPRDDLKNKSHETFYYDLSSMLWALDDGITHCYGDRIPLIIDNLIVLISTNRYTIHR